MATASEALRKAQLAAQEPPAARALPRPDKLPPNEPASSTVQRLIERGRLPFAVVEYPRLDSEQQPVCKVHVRMLTVSEETAALVFARQSTARKVAGTEAYEHRPEEIEYNERMVSILSVAVRDAEDPSKPFYQSRMELEAVATPVEIGVLARVYASVRDRVHPNLGEMNEAECEQWLDVVTKGLLADPFSYPSRDQLETFCAWAVKSLASLRSHETGIESTSS